MTENEAKLITGKFLLNAMKGIDEALAIIYELPNEYDAEITKLRDAKADLKRVLNKHFDECAINKANK